MEFNGYLMNDASHRWNSAHTLGKHQSSMFFWCQGKLPSIQTSKVNEGLQLHTRTEMPGLLWGQFQYSAHTE